MEKANQYRNYELDTASPEDSVALLYDGARRFVDRALVALEKSDYEQVNHNVSKAQRILSELAAALNFEAGSMAQDLFRLYEYWIWRLRQGLIHKDPACFREVSGVLADMREAWAEAARQVRTQRGLRAHG